MQEPLIGVLNRRFVFCFYDAFAARRGGDAAAVDFYKKNGGTSYGALFTPGGAHLGSFGYDMADFYAVILQSKRTQPEFWRYTKAEQAVLDAASAHPAEIDAAVAAARLHAELLEFEQADAVLTGYLTVVEGGAGRKVAKYWRLHHRLAHNELEFHRYARGWRTVSAERRRELTDARAELRGELAALTGLPEDLEDDRALDEINTHLALAKRQGFYTGWYFAKDDAERIAVALEKWITEHPGSNRIGQMHFFLGLAQRALGHNAGADAIWQRHWARYPADRFAMLSRFHHTSYQFSPYGGGRGTRLVGKRGKRLSSAEVEAALDRLKPRKVKDG